MKTTTVLSVLAATAAFAFGTIQPAHAGDAATRAAAPMSASAADAALKGKVEAAIAETTSLQDADIRVNVKDGVVLLSGLVASAGQRDTAAQRAAGVEGALRVINELVTKGS